MILVLENNIKGNISSVMGERYAKADIIRKIKYIDDKNSYGWAMLKSLPYDRIKFEPCVSLEEILHTSDG